MFQIIKGYSYLKNFKDLALDYSIDNILIKNEKQIKIDDFGFMTLINSIKNKIVYVHFGFAPEIFYQEKYYRNKSEVYSLGTIFYKMLFGKYPSNQQSIEKYVQDVVENGIKFPLSRIFLNKYYYFNLI